MLALADSIRIPLADGVVQCVVTSPPYWGLRAYSGEQERVWDGAADCEHEWQTHRQAASGGRNTAENPPNISGNATQQAVPNPSRDGVTSSFCQRCGAWRGGLGLEPTPELFIEHLVQVFREVRRVMRPDAVAWVNMGDCYNGSGGDHKAHHKNDASFQTGLVRGTQRRNLKALKPKDLVMMPHRLALALQADGWWVRSDVVWAKPNPMPESLSGWRWEQCKVKATDDWQPCTGCPKCAANDGLVLRRGSWRPTSSHEYVFMLAKSSTYFSDGEAVRETTQQDWGSRNRKNGKYHNAGTGLRPHTGLERSTSGRNLRSVWNIATQPFKGAHYATFPEKLVRTCILASTSRHACAECGASWAQVVEQKSHHPSCRCGAGVRPCIVLDPFCGSGTVGQVCRELPFKRDFVGLDISLPYLQDQALVRSERKTPAAAIAELPLWRDDSR